MNVKRAPRKDDTTMTEMADVLLDPEMHQENALNQDAHFSGIDNGYQSENDILSSRHKEKLSFQDWTAKYHQ